MRFFSSIMFVLAFTTSFAYARQTSTECSFKNNPKNKIYLDFTYEGYQLFTAKAMLILQSGGKGKDFTYYNYNFMTEAMKYEEYIPYGRRAEFVNFTDDLERSGKYSFRIVNFQSTATSVELISLPASRKELATDRGVRRIGFDAVLKTILKTENFTALENGKDLSVNEVSCTQRLL